MLRSLKTCAVRAMRSSAITGSIRTAATFSVPMVHTQKTVSMNHIAPTLVFKRNFAAGAQVTGEVGDVIPFNLADIGEGIAECEVLQWFIKPGDTIEQFQKICEVQSDKANVEISSRYDGVVQELMYDVGAMAQVGSPLITIKLTTATAPAGGKNTPKAAAPAKAAAAAPATTPNAYCPLATHRANSDVLASPVVRRMAREMGIELGHVNPTGIKGQVTKDDLLAFKSHAASSPAPAAAMVADVAGSSPAAASAPAAPLQPIPTRGAGKTHEDTEMAVVGIQKVMVKTMAAAAAIPTLGFADEICVDGLIALRKRVADKAKATGVKLSYFAFIIKAMSLALNKYPMINAHVNSDCSVITRKGAHNIGLAMDTPKGLLVPNIKNVQDLSILEIGAELNRLQALGKEGKLGPNDLRGGTITLSNIGSIGGTYCQPILVVPEACIGALGRFTQKAAFREDGTVYPSTVMNIGWTADHRALDGATVARFSNEMKDLIENPESMILY